MRIFSAIKGTTHGTVWEQYSRMRDALNATGRPIYYSITQSVPFEDAHPAMHCYGNSVFTTLPWVKAGLDPTTLANSYLVEYCNNYNSFGFTGGVPKPGGFLSNLDSQQLLALDNLTQVGAYSDNDMLQSKAPQSEGHNAHVQGHALLCEVTHLHSASNDSFSDTIIALPLTLVLPPQSAMEG
jgi:hypothetical protein